MAGEKKQDDLRDAERSDSTPAQRGGATRGGGAGSGLGLSDEARARAQTEEHVESTRDAVASQNSAAPEMRPAGAPQAARTVPSSGGRGSGGGLGDAAGGARRATAAEMTGDTGHLGDVSIDVPPGGSATQGAAQGGGMSGGTADPHRPGSADPGAGTATTGAPPPETPNRGGADGTGLGQSPAGGALPDFDEAFTRRDDEHS